MKFPKRPPHPALWYMVTVALVLTLLVGLWREYLA